MTLQDQYLAVAKFPNGPQVARRMVQIWVSALDPENDNIADGIRRTEETIVGSEEQLLNRTREEILDKGSVLPLFFKSMCKSSDEEWQNLVDEIKPPLLRNSEARVLFGNVNGLIRNKKFREWALGLIENPIDPETLVGKTKEIG
ncbi:MAG: hypothetical protein AAB838_02010 [Patescibacteria group bacterium]